MGIKRDLSVLSFKQKQKPLVGLDISSSSVKLLELGKTRKGYRVEAYAIEPLPSGSVQEKNIIDPEVVGNTIKTVVQRSGTKCREAAIAVAGSAAISKIITMPSDLSEDEMEAQIQIEADQHIPYPLEEVNLDFEVLGPTQANPGTVDVLIAAARSEYIDTRVAAVEMGGLKTRVVDIEPFTVENTFSLLQNGLPSRGSDMTVAIIDMGATMTSLHVFHNGQLRYTREHAFGGAQLTEEIMRRYQMSYSEAGKAKKTGNLPDSYPTEVLEPFKDTCAQQVSRFLQFYYGSGQQKQLDLILLGGGSAAISHLDEMLSERTGILTQVANPFTGMSVASKVPAKALDNDAPSMLIACGLALRSFD